MDNYALMAYMLISSAPGTPLSGIDECEFEYLKDATHKLAIDWEIMDSREKHYILAHFDNFESDIAILQSRYYELKFAPRLSQIINLPDRASINEAMKFNREYLAYLENLQLLYSFPQYQVNEAIRQTNILYKFWDEIRDANADFYYIVVRRRSAMNAIRIIGPEAYYSRQFPPTVPLWSFREIGH